MTYDEERGSLLDQDSATTSTAPDVLPIHISDINHDVRLLDISSNKKWIAYVTYRNDFNSETSSYNQAIFENTKIFITRRRFTAWNENMPAEEELGFSGNLASSADLKHASIDITDDVNFASGTYCKFLSISNDGKYVALSFYENISKHKRTKNPNCLIFDLDKKSSDPHKIKGQGRAVFLNDQKYSLAIISKDNLELYAGFPEIKTAASMLDLSCFYSNRRRTCSTVNKQESYINNASWANIHTNDKNDSSYISTVITFTRHIRNNILITPFTSEGIVRIWSILDEGARFGSFHARDQHIMALSKCYAFAAAYVKNSRSINVYHIKSGLLVHRLKSREKSDPSNFRVSHIRLCYDARYVAMSGLEGDEEVAFEVWHVETGISIYRTTRYISRQVGTEDEIDSLRRVEPFVTRELKNNQKCLKGYFTSYPNGKMKIMCVELEIDRPSDDNIVNWIPFSQPDFESKFEIQNGLNNFDGMKCGYVEVGGRQYLLRIGLNTVQLWYVHPKISENNLIESHDKLLYIKSFKSPDYGLAYSFRETWEITDFDSIKYIGGNLSGRLIVNIQNSERHEYRNHTEEIFLPIEELLPPAVPQPFDKTPKKQFGHHKLESACQTLHYFFLEDPDKSFTDPNWNTIREKTNELIKSSISDIRRDCNYFTTIAGSRTLAMLASFEDGRNAIKLIMTTKVPISIFSYPRSQCEIDKTKPPKRHDDRYNDYPQRYSDIPILGDFTESNMPKIKPGEIFYRSSTYKPYYRTSINTTVIAPKENVLTVLIDEISNDLYKLIFNRILLNSKSIGPGCLLSLTDTLLYLEEKKKHSLLLSSSAKLSYLEVDYDKLGILEYEYLKMIAVEIRQDNYIGYVDRLEAYTTMEQIRMYKGHLLFRRHLLQKYLRWMNSYILINYMVHLYNKSTAYSWNLPSLSSIETLEHYVGVCLAPITHFNSNMDLYENISNVRKKDTPFVRVALNHHFNDLIQQGDIILELLLKYKWQHFAKSKFILICFIHGIYYVSYCTSVLFAPEMYGLNLEEDIFLEHPGQIVSITLMMASLLILMVQEYRQFYSGGEKRNYFFSGYNWIDMCAFLLPIFTLIQLCNNWSYFVEVCSVATLVLWTHAILRLRVISHFGVTLEIIIQLSKKIAPLLLIMLLVILAFTQSYIVLLRLQPDEYFRDAFSGVFFSKNDSSTGEVGIEGNVEFTTSSDNGFSNWLTAFYNVWLFIYGVWDPIVEGDAGSSLMVMGLSVVFSLIAVLIFFNVVIAIMSSVIEEVDSRGKKAWITHFTDVLLEIETLWCFKEKYNLKKNPRCLYYLASKATILERKENLEEETVELEEKLKI